MNRKMKFNLVVSISLFIVGMVMLKSINPRLLVPITLLYISLDYFIGVSLEFLIKRIKEDKENDL